MWIAIGFVAVVLSIVWMIVYFQIHYCKKVTIDSVPYSYENGVYYFEYSKHFGESLKGFLEKNEQFEVSSMAPYVADGYTRGYFIIFRKQH